MVCDAIQNQIGCNQWGLQFPPQTLLTCFKTCLNCFRSWNAVQERGGDDAGGGSLIHPVKDFRWWDRGCPILFLPCITRCTITSPVKFRLPFSLFLLLIYIICVERLSFVSVLSCGWISYERRSLCSKM